MAFQAVGEFQLLSGRCNWEIGTMLFYFWRTGVDGISPCVRSFNIQYLAWKEEINVFKLYAWSKINLMLKFTFYK